MLKTRSVQSESRKDDGLRILATRFRGRGLPASKYDVWMPALGPSEQLLKAVMGGAIEWKTFARRYHDELFLDGPHNAGKVALVGSDLLFGERQIHRHDLAVLLLGHHVAADSIDGRRCSCSRFRNRSRPGPWLYRGSQNNRGCGSLGLHGAACEESGGHHADPLQRRLHAS